MSDTRIDLEQPSDHAVIREVVLRAVPHEPEVADMVEAIRDSAGYRPEDAHVARRDAAVIGFVMHSTVQILPEWQSPREVLSLAPRQAAQVHLLGRARPTLGGHVVYPPAIADLSG